MRITMAGIGSGMRWIGTHEDPGTPQAQGQSVPTVWTWVKTNAHAYDGTARVWHEGRVPTPGTVTLRT